MSADIASRLPKKETVWFSDALQAEVRAWPKKSRM
jgi:hypothetical protein